MKGPQQRGKKQQHLFIQERVSPRHLLVRGKVPNPLLDGRGCDKVSSKGNFLLIVKSMGLLHFLLEAEEKELWMEN